MMTNEQFEELLAREHEITGVEFKGPGSLKDKHFCTRVVKAVLGMVNRQDGGLVVIGVSETSGILNPVGLLEEDFVTWRFDDISTAISNYADPYVHFDLSTPTVKDKRFVVLQVHEFDYIPVLCKKKYEYKKQDGTFEQVLREGALYVRTRRKPETTEIPSQTEMRDLLEIAIRKGVQKFVSQAYAAGLNLSGSVQSSDQELFQQELENLATSLLEKIRSRGYWRTIIRPDKFSQEKLSYDSLYPLVQNSAVNIFGGGFPNVGQEFPISRGTNQVGQEIEAGYFLEIWYLYQSGQFIHYSDILDDWINVIDQLLTSPQWKPGKFLSIEEVIRQFTGIFVFASRLALTDVYSEDVHIVIDVLLKGLQGRLLYIGTPGKVPLRRPYEAQILEFLFTTRIQKDELIAHPKELALQASRELFLRFGWDPAQVILENIQSTFNLT